MTAAGMRAYDRHASEACGVPGVVLMENAGRGAAELIAARMSARSGPAVIVCGKGNNGGDGFVVARHLEARGLATEVFLVGRRDDVRGDARVNLEALLGLGVEVVELDEGLGALEEGLSRASVVVDALFGTGLSRPVDGLAKEAIEAVAEALVPVIALDVPSGIDATTGEVLGVAVRATVTLSFAHLKTGLLQGAGVRYAGAVELVGLGLPDGALLDAVGYEAEAVEAADVRLARGFRAPDAHKYRAGNVVVFGGSRGKVGAALLAASAALRGGAGLATIASWPEVVDALDGRVLEIMTLGLDRGALSASIVEALARRGALVVGPGLGLDEPARELARRVALEAEAPAVLDADALSAFAGHAEQLASARGVRVLTPHGGELTRLLDTTVAAIESDRFGAARRAAAATRAVVVLKGPHTVVAHPDGEARFVHGALPALATAGAGDVLAGLTAAFLAAPSPKDGLGVEARLQHAFDVACAAAFVHLAAARLALGRLSAEAGELDRGLLAGDVVDALPAALAGL
ncbi:MAG: NAD(P)H-hydrate dehydratase [Deltaproteobacteria bacterium]|nr:NAD(P)H-hydrate dehydratase [Deltaproteobacteria bacterium]